MIYIRHIITPVVESHDIKDNKKEHIEKLKRKGTQPDLKFQSILDECKKRGDL